MLKVVMPIRSVFYGEQVYSTALKGCSRSLSSEEWVHPATLALTVYGDVQRLLNEKVEVPPVDVLPKYSIVPRGDDELLCVADYLLNNSSVQVMNGAVQVRAFSYNFPKPVYKLPAEWVSGLAQSFVGQVFLASYILTEDMKYLEAAIQTTNLLKIEINHGGTLHKIDDTRYWYAEYAKSGHQPPMVLNGHFLALDLLYWMNSVVPDEQWSELFTKGLNAAVTEINSFVAANWSYYDSQQNYATGKYHRFHIRQLSRYSDMDDTGALERAKKEMDFQLRIPLGVIERLIYQPSRLLIFIISSFLFVFLILYFMMYLFVLKKKQK